MERYTGSSSRRYLPVYDLSFFATSYGIELYNKWF
jgi:hypothetical protein